MKNIIYFFYYLKVSNWKRLKKHCNYVNRTYCISPIQQWIDIFTTTLKYGASFHEYYYYGFYIKNIKERKEYALTGFMYEYQKKNNPPQKRIILSDKIKFFQSYNEFLGRRWINPIITNIEDISNFIQGNEKVVLKSSIGGGGKNVQIIRISEYSCQEIQQLAKNNNFDIMEEFVYQHNDLQKLAPNSLNTIRIITQLTTEGNVNIIGASMRMGIEKSVDNLSSGGITAKINTTTGIIESNGVSFDITLPEYKVHPVSNIKINGFQIPFWQEVISLCTKAASKYSDNKSIGWDVAIKPDGPILIEGNHDWGARVWQMPAGRGLKKDLVKYL